MLGIAHKQIKKEERFESELAMMYIGIFTSGGLS